MLMRLDDKPRTHDYRKSMWGHSLHSPQVKVRMLPRTLWERLRFKRAEHAQYLTALGHGDVRKGDDVLVALKSGKTGRFTVQEIDRFCDPDDMFDIKRADFIGYEL